VQVVLADVSEQEAAWTRGSKGKHMLLLYACCAYAGVGDGCALSYQSVQGVQRAGTHIYEHVTPSVVEELFLWMRPRGSNISHKLAVSLLIYTLSACTHFSTPARTRMRTHARTHMHAHRAQLILNLLTWNLSAR